MDEKLTIMRLSALAQQTRLATFALLAKAGPAGLNAGELAARVGAPANTMSAHLTILTHAGMISQTRSGRNMLYHAVPQAIADLEGFIAGLRPEA
ncbi:ArsR family transcriptional regulator [Sphingomonas faeni]|nr:ArsR family transcriptional regulator [Sphingomonas faeni]